MSIVLGKKPLRRILILLCTYMYLNNFHYSKTILFLDVTLIVVKLK